MKKTLLLVCCFLAFFKQYAQTIDASLVEINSYYGSHPQNITKGPGNNVYFTADDGIHGRELWLHNTSTEETYMVKDIWEGFQSSIEQSTAFFTLVDDTLFFIARAPGVRALWKTDGTEEGTVIVKDLSAVAGSTDFNIGNFKSFNGILYFYFLEPTYGGELWISDGTEEGTHILKDIMPGTVGSIPSNLTLKNDKVYFFVSILNSGCELWETDGTEEGTVIVKHVTDSVSGDPFNVLVFDDRLFFFCYDDAHGYELWHSDGTEEGTTLFKEFIPGSEGLNSAIRGIAMDDYFVFFYAFPESVAGLWKSDGTPEGTVLIKPFNEIEDPVRFDNFVSFNNSVYFTGEFLGPPYTTSQIWKTDGTGESTVIVKDMSTEGNGEINNFTLAENLLIYSFDEYSTSKPWVSDGTQTGTAQLADIDLRSDIGEIHFTPVDNMIFFPASLNERQGNELWKTQGILNDVEKVSEIYHAYSSLNNKKQIVETLGDKMIFIATETLYGDQLYVSNGTKTGTHLLKNLRVDGSSPFYSYNERKIFTKINDKLYFVANDGEHGNELFVTDGTYAGTNIIKDINPGFQPSFTDITYLMVYNDLLFFKANDGIHGEELWRTDGTEEGTYMLKDIYSGAESGMISYNNLLHQNKGYTVFNNLLYFVAKNASGTSVWSTDGTEAGTVPVISYPAGDYYNPRILGSNDTKIFYGGMDYTDFNLWSTDGTQEGSILLGNYPASEGTQLDITTIFNNELYYTVYIPGSGANLMKSDGTNEGTVLVDSGFGTIHKAFNSFLQGGDYLYFNLGGTFPDLEQLWRTDGTAEGTTLIYSENSTTYGNLRDYAYIDNNLYYILGNTVGSLWVTDGNPENNTELEINVYNDSPTEWLAGAQNFLGYLNGQIFFAGSTLYGGTELYITGEGVLGIHNPTEGLTEQNEVNDFIVYPNPTKGDFTISSVNEASIDNIVIYDFTGKKITERSINFTSATFNLSGLAKGIYFCKIKSNNTYITKKVVLN